MRSTLPPSADGTTPSRRGSGTGEAVAPAPSRGGRPRPDAGRGPDPTGRGPDATGRDGRTPVVALLGRAKTAYVAAVDARLHDSEFCALSLSHSRNVLRHLRQGPQRASQIVSRCDVTKQAVSQQIAHLERNGYVTVEPDPHDQRARLLSLTAKGEAAQRLLEEIFDDVERAWADQVGEKDIESLRRILGEVPGATPGAC